jgi:tRNA threonylcarbamoyladenosine biosynthesis protein TsaE
VLGNIENRTASKSDILSQFLISYKSIFFDMHPLTYTAENESATAALGAALAEVLPGGSTVALCGTLGAGKTRLVQAIAEALGVDRRTVVSPTFVLVQEYAGRRMIYHFDAYRLKDIDEFLALGPEEYFESDGLVFVEWADRVAEGLPEEYLRIEILATAENARHFVISAQGNKYATVIERLAARLS